jgi:hypothetical protein
MKNSANYFEGKMESDWDSSVSVMNSLGAVLKTVLCLVAGGRINESLYRLRSTINFQRQCYIVVQRVSDV